jgi:hypothetical protein
MLISLDLGISESGSRLAGFFTANLQNKFNTAIKKAAKIAVGDGFGHMLYNISERHKKKTPKGLFLYSGHSMQFTA